MSKTAEAASGQSPLIHGLLKSIDASPGFIGLDGAVSAISSLVDGDGNNSDIAAVVLRDPALTAKLLQLTNSGRFARSGSSITTIDQAVAIMGMNNVKSAAAALPSLNSVSNKLQLNQLQAEIVAGFFTGSLAYAITRNNSAFSAQEAQVCGLMQNLGRMMTVFYLYEDIEKSRKLQNEMNITEDEAVLQTMGTSFEDMGDVIAHHWKLPDSICKTLVPDTTTIPPQAAADLMSWLQLCSLFCRRITESLFRLPENQEKYGVADQISFFQRSLKLNEKTTAELIDKCLLETDEALTKMSFPSNVEDSRLLLRKASERAMDMLSSQDTLTKEIKGGSGQSPIEMAKHYMRLMHDHCNFDTTLICLPSGSAGLQVIAGVGKNVGPVSTKIRSVGMKKDIFQAVMSRKADVFVNDVVSSPYAGLIPEWYRESVAAKSFVLLSIASEDKLVCLIYGDYVKPVDAQPPELKAPIMAEWRTNLMNVIRYGPKGRPDNA
jgi:eukaryotic-like serine/threonine-protein kinase